MPYTPQSRRNRIVLIIIIILLIALITMYVREGDSGPLHKVQQFAVDTISPIGSGLARLFRPIKNGISDLFHLPSLAREKRELQEQVDELKRGSIEARALEAENEKLKKLLKWTEEHPKYDTLAAEIVGRSPDNWLRVMVLNKGSSHGVKKYMSVVTERGLVGRVISVGSRSSVVQLVTDSGSGVGGRLLDSRELGIVEGKNQEILSLELMNQEGKVEKGEVLMTSGLGGTCPPGIPIGKVTKVEDQVKGLTKKIEVKPFVQFSRLDQVLVVMSPEPETGIFEEE